MGAGYGQGVHSDLKALAFSSQQVLLVNLAVGEFQLAMTSAAAAHHMRHVDYFKSRSIHGYEECRQSVILVGFRIGHCDYISELTAVGMRNKGLLAVQHIGVTVFYCGGM